MKLIANMVAYNEAEFIEAAIRSTIEVVDKMIVIEGAWGEFLRGNPNASKHSNDGTLNILKKLEREYPKKLLVNRSDQPSQLQQRNVYFELCPQEEHVMLLQDADEVWTQDEIAKVKIISQNLPAMHCVRVQSLVFINDLEHASQVEYPRIWSMPSTENMSRGERVNYHQFLEPNRIRSGGYDYYEIPTQIYYFHYSYCHNVKRFQEKKRERTALHGSFAWECKNGQIQREKWASPAKTGKFEIDKHPELIFKYGKYKK